MKNILIPTDFTIESLNLFKAAAQHSEDENNNIILFHGIDFNDSILDLLFFSPRRVLHEMLTKEFEDACHIIQNKYASGIRSFRTELFIGNNQSVFQTFLDRHKITEVFIPQKYEFVSTSGHSIDSLPFIRQCSLPIMEVSWDGSGFSPERHRLAELFHTSVESKPLR